MMPIRQFTVEARSVSPIRDQRITKWPLIFQTAPDLRFVLRIDGCEHWLNKAEEMHLIDLLRGAEDVALAGYQQRSEEIERIEVQEA